MKNKVKDRLKKKTNFYPMVGCTSTGPHYNPYNETHGGPDAETRHVGDFGNLVAQEDGTAILNITTNSLKLCGKRSIVGYVFLFISCLDYKYIDVFIYL